LIIGDDSRASVFIALKEPSLGIGLAEPEELEPLLTELAPGPPPGPLVSLVA
jgi:hypothetical protein